jgi:hypothetical protein
MDNIVQDELCVKHLFFEQAEVQKQQQYAYVTDSNTAWRLLLALDRDEVHALDFETTSLSPETGLIRLTTICGHGHAFIIDHFKAMPFQDIAEWLAKREWAVFNAGFEGNWIDYHADNIDVQLYDVGHMRRAKLGGGPLWLRTMSQRDLKIALDKSEQQSNWSQLELTPEQIDYAMLDGVVTDLLFQHWCEELTPEQWLGFLVINDAWRGTKEMEATGLQLDTAYHAKMLNWWTLKRDMAERYLRRWTPPAVLENLRSKPQLSTFFKEQVLDDAAFIAWPKTGKRLQLNLERNTLRQAAHRLPYPQSRWVAALIIFNKMEKYISTYGQKLIDAQLKWGRVTSRFNMAAAVTGRYSSSNFNLQNIPRNPVVRRSFVTSSKTMLVIADYSSIEVRVLAELAKDEILLNEAIYGNVHARSAAAIFNLDFEHFLAVIDGTDPKHNNVRPVFKGMRSRAKAFTFQLLYGAGASALAVPLRCTDEEAHSAIEAWAKTYPKAYHYRQLMYEKMMASGFLPICDGRTVFVFKQDRTMPVAANYPVQGAAASVMYRAVTRVHQALWNNPLQCRMAATVHDELLLYAAEKDAEESAGLLVDCMVEGWSDIFPKTDTHNLVGDGNCATIATNWGSK